MQVAFDTMSRPQKTELIYFIRKYKIPIFDPLIKIYSLVFSEEVELISTICTKIEFAFQTKIELKHSRMCLGSNNCLTLV